MPDNYFGGLLALCVFVSVALGVAHPRMKKAISFGAGVLIICAIMLPLVDILVSFKSDNALDGLFDNINYDATDNAIELAFEEGLAEYVSLKYDVDQGDVLVKADGFDMEKLRAERIYVTLAGKAVLIDYKSLEDEIGKQFTFSGECEVSISLG